MYQPGGRCRLYMSDHFSQWGSGASIFDQFQSGFAWIEDRGGIEPLFPWRSSRNFVIIISFFLFYFPLKIYWPALDGSYDFDILMFLLFCTELLIEPDDGINQDGVQRTQFFFGFDKRHILLVWWKWFYDEIYNELQLLCSATFGNLLRLLYLQELQSDVSVPSKN